MTTTHQQCKACPWKRSTVPERDIPGGYCEQKHRALRGTIAKPGNLSAALTGSIRVFACHDTPVGAERPCAGWLAHQLGPGNNIRLRLLARDGRFGDIVLDGEQHTSFEHTLPREGGAR